MHTAFCESMNTRLSSIERAQRATDAEFEALRNLLPCTASEPGSTAFELVTLLKSMRRSIRVNSEAVLQQDERARKLVRHVCAFERLPAPADGAEGGAAVQRQSLAELREQ
eukprot:3440914-Prymnesium_polylepis.1